MILQCTFDECQKTVDVLNVHPGPLLVELKRAGWGGRLVDVDEDLGLALVGIIRCPEHPIQRTRTPRRPGLPPPLIIDPASEAGARIMAAARANAAR